MTELNDKLNKISESLHEPRTTYEEYNKDAERNELHYKNEAKKLGRDYVTARYFKNGLCFATSCVYKGFKQIKDIVEIIIHW